MSWDDMKNLADRLGLTTTSARPDPAPRRKRTRAGVEDRPSSLPTMVGNDRARTLITMSVRGAMISGTFPGHFLLYGPPGLGKTSLAALIAGTTNGQMIEAIGSQLTTDTFAHTIGQLRGKDARGNQVVDVLFIDEIHELTQKVETLLYRAMEDNKVELRVGRGASARVQQIFLPPWILVGATTLPGYLSQPFRDRFRTKLSLEYYTVDELTKILTDAAVAQELKLDPDAAAALALRSRGTPRVALSLLTTSRDYSRSVAGLADVPITLGDATTALSLLEIDDLGLDRDHRNVLLALCKRHNGGPVGVDNLAASANVDNKTLAAAIEPYLIRADLIRRTTAGRKATSKAFTHLGMETPAHCQEDEEEL